MQTEVCMLERIFCFTLYLQAPNKVYRWMRCLPNYIPVSFFYMQTMVCVLKKVFLFFLQIYKHPTSCTDGCNVFKKLTLQMRLVQSVESHMKGLFWFVSFTPLSTVMHTVVCVLESFCFIYKSTNIQQRVQIHAGIWRVWQPQDPPLT